MTRIHDLDRRYVWHPFTAMQQWMDEEQLVIARAEGNTLIDDAGRRFIDGVSSLWVNVHGHNRPEINQAIIEQVHRVAHSTLLGLTNEPAAAFAEELAKACPGTLNRVFYSDSGSTAVEIALKQSFQYWALRGRPEKHRFVHLDHSYHGDTLGAVGVGGIPGFHERFGPLLRPGLKVLSPAPCRVPRPASESEALESALADLERVLGESSSEIAAFIVEPLVQGAAGMWVHPAGYLERAAELCRAHDVLVIADEVAVGFGRTGALFACELERVVPDFLCLAKGISGGYLPLAATVARDEIFDAFLEPSATFFHGHTYTGNPIACAAARASLALFATDRTLEHVSEMSRYLGEALRLAFAEDSRVGDIRQRGLMVGVELVADAASMLPFDPERRVGAAVCRAARQEGVLLRNLGDVIVLMPPLTIRPDEVDALVAGIRSGMEQVL